MCPDCEAKIEAEAAEELRKTQQERIERWVKQLPADTRGAAFDNFDVKHNGKALVAVQKWCQDYNIGKYPSMVLYSKQYGVGKTHLACAVANDIIKRTTKGFCPVRFTNGPLLLDRIKNTYRQDAHETKSDVLQDLAWVPLLILDDVGKEKASDHTREVYYEIINDRVNTGFPVFITSNLPLEARQGNSLTDLMGGAAISRLIQMCQGNYYELTGPDYRRGKHVRT
ncbi:MAG: ATP-binding protein [Dehalococcoidales bacterium]|nr:ATP-binding protein [Dehalococcoidales bacterium]